MSDVPCWKVPTVTLDDGSELYPGAVHEIVNDGIDNCEVCQNDQELGRANLWYQFHGHAPYRWELATTRGGTEKYARCFYICDLCGHRWVCSWSLREGE